MAQVISPLNNLIKNYNIVEGINQYTTPVFEKASNVKDSYEQLKQYYFNQAMSYKNQAFEKGIEYKNVAMEKGTYYKNQAIETGMQYKDQAVSKGNQIKEVTLEKGKNYRVTKYTEKQLKTIISYMEKQVQMLNNNYLHKNITQDLAIENGEEQGLVKRMYALSQTINTLARLTIQDQLKNIKQMPVSQKSVAMYQQLMSNPKVREVLIFTSISQELLSEMIQTKLLVPSFNFDIKSIDFKNQTKITIENIKTKVVKQYIPLMAEKFTTLKNSTIYFYENQMTIEFAKEFYQKNQVLVQKEMKELYSAFLKLQGQVKLQYNGVYNNALELYKKKRIERIEKLENPENSTSDSVKVDESESNDKKDQ